MSQATALDSKVDDIFDYIQERCLWQYYSRTWDRQDNIEGVLSKAADLFLDREPKRETPMDKLHCADAKILVKDCRERYPWTRDVEEQEIRALMDSVKTRLVDVAITKSKNRELNHHLY